jgi:hypothetical protein
MAVLRRLGLTAALVLLLPLPQTAKAAGRATSEYDLKAAFLFNFTHFVQWPADLLPANKPLTIGILGEDPFGGSLDEMVSNETVEGHKLLVRRLASPDRADSCHIVFISSKEATRLERAKIPFKRRGVLTVGENKDFAQRSGIIGFVVAERRLQLVVNLAAAHAAGLTISSKLLRQSRIVGQEKSPG